MKRKPDDWANRAAMRCVTLAVVSRALRVAEKRGFKRAVKLLREKHWTIEADWLEEQERK